MLWLPITSAVVNVALLVVVFWYTRETSRLRQQNQDQLEVLKGQVRLSIAPYVLPTLLNLATSLHDVANVDEEEDADVRKKFEANCREKFDTESGKTRVFCALTNLTNSLALNVTVYMFDHRSQDFFGTASASGLSFLSRYSASNKLTELEMSEASLRAEQLAEQLRLFFPASHESFLNELMSKQGSSFVAALYIDQDDNPYLTRRAFEGDRNSVIRQTAIEHVRLPKA